MSTETVGHLIPDFKGYDVKPLTQPLSLGYKRERITPEKGALFSVGRNLGKIL